MSKMTAEQARAYERYLELRHQDAKSPYRILENEFNKSYQTIKNWAEKYNWVGRANESIERVSDGVEKLIEDKKISGIHLSGEYLDAVIRKGLSEIESNNIKIKHDDVVKAIELVLKIFTSQANLDSENNGSKSNSMSGQSKDTFTEFIQQMTKFNKGGET